MKLVSGRLGRWGRAEERSQGRERAWQEASAEEAHRHQAGGSDTCRATESGHHLSLSKTRKNRDHCWTGGGGGGVVRGGFPGKGPHSFAASSSFGSEGGGRLQGEGSPCDVAQEGTKWSPWSRDKKTRRVWALFSAPPTSTHGVVCPGV